ncbi:MAG: hypothetical protein KJ977_05355 [Candidatus Omnitrophica bacterium]|nr:hypothetical protein [Candidatus Omnitrophota bacterium]
MAQKTFSGINYGFRWTDDDWYEYDGVQAEKKALKARNAFVKELKADGYRPTTFSLGSQLVSRGGIGSGNPHIEIWTKCYGVNW